MFRSLIDEIILEVNFLKQGSFTNSDWYELTKLSYNSIVRHIFSGFLAGHDLYKKLMTINNTELSSLISEIRKVL